MKKYILFGGYLLLLAYITSCDDGRIYEKTETLSEEGRTLKMSGMQLCSLETSVRFVPVHGAVR